VTKPVLQALLLADHIYQDRDTGKMVIAGTFTGVAVSQRNKEQESAEVDKENQASELPPQLGNTPLIGQIGSPYAYICLTDMREEANLELRFVDLTDSTALFRVDLNVQCKNPLQAVELKIPLPKLPMPHFGAYSFELLCEDELLGSWRVTMTSVEDLAEER